MANILVTFADKYFRNSAWVLKREAARTRFFDKIVVYTPDDLPPCITGSPLFAFPRGCGYWVWKPYIIAAALRAAKPGDRVYYMDAGCRINPAVNDWPEYSRLLDDHSALFFAYREDFHYDWDCFGINSVKLRHWTKPATARYFTEYLGNDDFLSKPKIWAGFCAFKKCEHSLILDQWLKITLMHPELVIDPFGKELAALPDDFNCHRHDQTILAPLVYMYGKDQNAVVVPEKAESQREQSSVMGSRYKIGVLGLVDTIKFKLYHILKSK